MKFNVWIFRFAIAQLLAISTVLEGQINAFSGTWRNADSGTRALTTLSIQAVGGELKIRAWGKCTPHDCYLGVGSGTAYGPSVDDNVAETATAVSAFVTTSFTEDLFIIRIVATDKVQVEHLIRFTDHSGRANLCDTSTFVRTSRIALLQT